MKGVLEHLQTGTAIGRYRLLFQLGKGGMGEVWAAQYPGPSGFAKEVALKLMPAPSLESNTGLMFIDEAKATAALQHPAIVPTFDLGHVGDIAYISMELVRGPSLNALLQKIAPAKKPLPPAIIAYLGQRIAAALDYAYHRASIEGRTLHLVHRDVSPQNILLDASGSVRLSDFGIARFAVQSHLSAVGTLRGKPGYISPEQATGGPLDERSDQFALGVVLYECGIMRRLFWRGNADASIEAAIDEPVPPLASEVPGFPEPLGSIIDRALEKDPARRHASNAELARLLGDFGRTCADWPTAASDLARIIDGAFPPGTFDLDRRIQSAREEINPPADPTVKDRRPRSAERLTAVEPNTMPDAEARGASFAPWPSVDSSNAAGFEPPAQAHTKVARPFVEPVPGATTVDRTVRHDKRTSRLAVGVIAAATIVLVALGIALVAGDRAGDAEVSGASDPAGSLSPAAKGGLRASAGERARAGERASEVREAATSSVSPPATPPGPATSPGAPVAPPGAKRPRTPKSVDPPAPQPPPQNVDVAELKGRIGTQIRALRAKDKEAAGRLIVRLTDVVQRGDDPTELAALLVEVERALAATN